MAHGANGEASAPQPPGGQMLIYQDGAMRLHVRLTGGTGEAEAGAAEAVKRAWTVW